MQEFSAVVHQEFKYDVECLVFISYHLQTLLTLKMLRVHIHNLGWIECASSSAYDSLINYMLTHLPRELGTLRLILDKLNEVAVKQKKTINLRSIKEFLEENGTY